MTPDAALTALRALAEPGRAEGMAAYHKQSREVIGISNPALNAITTDWRRTLPVPERVSLAGALWETDIFEARIAAAKLLTQARIRPDAEAWQLIATWAHDLDSWAIADHAMMAAQKRLAADPARLDEVEGWTTSENLWTRRAALVATLPFAKKNHPNATEAEVRARVLGWAEGYVSDKEWFIQKAVAWWLRDLSKHDAEATRAFLDGPGKGLKPFARREAAKHL
ncbi:DNA alkylation repair protein [Vannielia litorea]|uniref:DNA alkylation repair protein n=1 Tax=Vannielia litorea TaxID=1217970 RepID=UPI001BCEC99C|nr:DNA alkylation repair protein [Vannielia litorea]MBS8228646.1 DNA alkylation repair protein [Vannielia litorea]